MSGFIVRRRRWTLPLALGLSDGILNALVLSSGAVLRARQDLTTMFAAKVGCVAFVTAIFAVFVAEYSEQRSRLSRAAHELNLSTRGALATTRLRRRVMHQAAEAAAVASVSSFVGATVPLAIAGAAASSVPWIGLLVAVALLGVLGAVLAVSFGARWSYWAAGLVVAGIAVALVGAWLDVT